MNPIRDEWTTDDGSIRLLLGDCLEILPGLERGSVDCVVTSPPYDNLREYGGYVFDFDATADEICRIVTAGGVVVWVRSLICASRGKELTSRPTFDVRYADRGNNAYPRLFVTCLDPLAFSLALEVSATSTRAKERLRVRPTSAPPSSTA